MWQRFIPWSVFISFLPNGNGKWKIPTFRFLCFSLPVSEDETYLFVYNYLSVSSQEEETNKHL